MVRNSTHNRFQGSSSADATPFQTIIVTIDPDGSSKPAVRPAAALARAFDASLIAIGAPGVVEQHRIRLESQARRPLQVRYLTPQDDVHDVVAEVAAGSAGPLTIMATHARRRVGYALAGSVAEDVLRTRVCPVLLIGPNCDPFWNPGLGSVSVALDGTDLSEQALPMAESWAQHFSSALTLMHIEESSSVLAGVAPRRIERSVSSLGGEVLTVPRAAEIGSRYENHQTPAETYMAGKANLSSNKGVDATWIVRSGRRPADLIRNHLQDSTDGLLVMTTHGRAGFGRIAVGSTTMAVAHDAPVPVLAFAPADYE